MKNLVENFPKQFIKDLAKEKLKIIEEEEKKQKTTLEKSDTTGN